MNKHTHSLGLIHLCDPQELLVDILEGIDTLLESLVLGG